MDPDIAKLKAVCWFITYNNPGVSSENMKKRLEKATAAGQIEAWVFQKEEGENKTPHFQMYIQMSKKCGPGAVKKIVSYHINLLTAKGSGKQCFDYCTKEEGRLEGPWWHGEFGSKAGHQGKRSDLDTFAEAVLETGDVTEEIIEKHSGYAMKYGKLARELVQFRARRKAANDRLAYWSEQARLKDAGLDWKGVEQREIIIYVGPTGTGKTTMAMLDAGRRGVHCYDKNTNKWWDGYDNEKYVVLDEFKGDDFGPIETFNKLTNKGVYTAEVKGGFVAVDCDTIAITSNSHPGDWWKEAKESAAGKKKFDAVIRRIDKVYWWNEAKTLTILDKNHAMWNAFWYTDRNCDEVVRVEHPNTPMEVTIRRRKNGYFDFC